MELDKLRLTANERKALETQGFVSQECRGLRRYYKLRFRLMGRQHVRYIGADFERARQIECELRQLRQQRERFQEIVKIVREGRALLRQTKKEVAAALEGSDLYFHGQEIRRKRM